MVKPQTSKSWSSFFDTDGASAPGVDRDPLIAVMEREPGATAGHGPRPPAASAPGLVFASYVHEENQTGQSWDSCSNLEPGEFRVTIADGGSLTKITEVARDDRPKRQIGKRGQVKGFSRAARLNMLAVVNGIDRTKIAGTFFVTLTARHDRNKAPTEADWREAERRRRAWVERFRRRFKTQRWFILWKKEPHPSTGHVHLHMLIFFLDGLPHLVREFRPWNDAAWAEVCNPNNPDYTAPACRSEFMRGWSGVAFYCAKYCAKEQFFGEVRTGKVWGVENRENLHAVTTLLQSACSRSVGIRVKRTLRKLQERRRSCWLARSTNGQWHRIRSARVSPDGLQPREYKSESEMVEWFKSFEIPVRRKKGRACRRRTVQVWGVVESDEIGNYDHGQGDSPGDLVLIGEEKQSYSPSMHFIDSKVVQRLLLLYAEQDQPPGFDDVPF